MAWGKGRAGPGHQSRGRGREGEGTGGLSRGPGERGGGRSSSVVAAGRASSWEGTGNLGEAGAGVTCVRHRRASREAALPWADHEAGLPGAPGRAGFQSGVPPSSQDVCPCKDRGACCQLPRGEQGTLRAGRHRGCRLLVSWGAREPLMRPAGSARPLLHPQVLRALPWDLEGRDQ